MKKNVLLVIVLCIMTYTINAQTNHALQITSDGTSFYTSGLPHILVSSLTIEGWVKFDDDVNLTDYTAIVDFRNADDVDSKALIFKNIEGNITTSYEWAGNWGYAGPNNIVPADEWTHVAVVICGDAAETTFYINGEATDVDFSYTGLGDDLSLGANIRVGAGLGAEPARTLVGKMDEIRIWNIARTEEEIKGNMEKEIDPASQGLLMYYKCNEESTDTILRDATDNKFDLVAIGTDYVFIEDTPFEVEPNFVSNSAKSLNISFYPNPVKNILNFNKNFQNAEIRIYGITGQLVKEAVINSSSMNIANLRTGIYFIEVKERDNIYNGKIIKE